MHWSQLLWWNLHNRWLQTRTKQSYCYSSDAPSPRSKKEVQLFFGMINYLSKFFTRLTEIAEPIKELVKEKVPFNWGPEHEESFAMLKREINKAPVLAYYNPWKETVLQTDASIKGLGACLLQEEIPVYFASKALTEDTEGIHGNRNRIPCSCMGSWKVPSLSIWMPLYAWDWSETTQGNSIQKP